jgi:chromosome segregation protein
LQEIRSTQAELLNASTQVQTQCRELIAKIEQLQDRLDSLEEVVGAAKQERDACERNLQALSERRRELEWQVQKNAERIATLDKELTKIVYDLENLELPEPLPEVPETMTLEQCQLEQRRLQKRLQALEPVNMMAIAEYESVTERLTDLSDRLETLNQERTELLLRIENFTTLRQRAFMQAFNAVNENFKVIFAELSDGDGHLQLENSADPLSGGLHLVAHPKGKQVQHLASMSGGEKSLTALSFIFALQRYRPSPFYAFDEVDMFLDGANVERLSKMVRKQAGLAQFIVVSLRRPMIEASERTIGVTQARGAHTQVLGLELRSG